MISSDSSLVTKEPVRLLQDFKEQGHSGHTEQQIRTLYARRKQIAQSIYPHETEKFIVFRLIDCPYFPQDVLLNLFQKEEYTQYILDHRTMSHRILHQYLKRATRKIFA